MRNHESVCLYMQKSKPQSLDAADAVRAVVITRSCNSGEFGLEVRQPEIFPSQVALTFPPSARSMTAALAVLRRA